MLKKSWKHISLSRLPLVAFYFISISITWESVFLKVLTLYFKCALFYILI